MRQNTGKRYEQRCQHRPKIWHQYAENSYVKLRKSLKSTNVIVRAIPSWHRALKCKSTCDHISTKNPKETLRVLTGRRRSRWTIFGFEMRKRNPYQQHTLPGRLYRRMTVSRYSTTRPCPPTPNRLYIIPGRRSPNRITLYICYCCCCRCCQWCYCWRKFTPESRESKLPSNRSAWEIKLQLHAIRIN